MSKNRCITLKPIANNKHVKEIVYGFAKTEIGGIFLAMLKERNNPICMLHFINANEKENCLLHLEQRWPNSKFVEEPSVIQNVANSIFEKNVKGDMGEIELVTNGSPFQQMVWQALLYIPPGELRTYSEVAEMINRPKAVRAVASAVANNEIGLLIPCHRVIGMNGNIYKYRAGSDIKQKLWKYENINI